MLAKCCMSDITIKMFDAQAIGDTENEVCLLEKALLLQGAMNALCSHYDSVELTSSFNTRAIASGGNTTISRWEFAGEEILPHGTVINTPTGTNMLNLLNSARVSGSVSVVAVVIGGDRLDVTYKYPMSKAGSEPDITASNGSVAVIRSGDEEPVDVANPPCLDDTQIEGIFNIIDKVCGCNCPEQHTSDFIPVNLI